MPRYKVSYTEHRRYVGAVTADSYKAALRVLRSGECDGQMVEEDATITYHKPEELAGDANDDAGEGDVTNEEIANKNRS